MKVRKLAALVCALCIALGCMGITSSADGGTTADTGNIIGQIQEPMLAPAPVAPEPTPSVTVKVQLDWEAADIEVSCNSNKTWNAGTFTWDEVKTMNPVQDGTATFELTNYSSVKITGTVNFTVEPGLASTLTSATFDDNNGKELAAAEDENNVSSNSITATLKFNADAFAEFAATDSPARYGTYTVSIATSGKQSQTISAPTAQSSAIRSSSITLTELATGHGATQYGINTSNTAPSSWQDETVFTGLSPDTTYYFFAKYAGDDEYEEAISAGTAIRTDVALTYTPIQQGDATKVYFLPAFDGGSNTLAGVLGEAKFYVKDGDTYTQMNTDDVHTMQDLADLIYNAGAASVYIGGTPAKAFYGTYDVSWNNAFHESDSDFSDQFKETLTQEGLPVTNVYTGSGNWNCSNQMDAPTLNGISYADFYDAYKSMLSDASYTVWSSVEYNPMQAYAFCADMNFWEFNYKASNEVAVVLTFFN